MSPYHSQKRSGAPTYTAVSASLSLSGLDRLDDFSPLDPNPMDVAEWYHHPGHDHDHDHAPYHLPPLSPGHDHFAATAFGPGDFASQGVAVTGPELHRPQYPTLTHPMNAIPHLQHQDHSAPRIDDLGVVSPLQTTYPPYQTPYPDSTGSSAPSEDPIIAGADDDKRKRNQAASARFRQKKKQREQQMAEHSREAQEKTKRLEAEVENLKRENTFLKKLLVEKVDNMGEEDRKLLVKTTNSVPASND